MNCIELSPSLSCCIECTAKRKFWDWVSQYMKNGKEDQRLEQGIELLKAFLETMDFGELRSKSEKYLQEGKEVKFKIYWKGTRPSYDIAIA